LNQCYASKLKLIIYIFFFQAEDGIRALARFVGSEMCIRDRYTNRQLICL